MRKQPSFWTILTQKRHIIMTHFDTEDKEPIAHVWFY